MRHWADKLWHKFLRRPYRLACPLDVGLGQPVVFLHGIGVSHRAWQYMPTILDPRHFRLVAFDLLGFGISPKPDWLAYNADDHARAVISSIDRLKLKRIILVGHSMGSLVAVRIARLRPDLVRHLILYQMPLYVGLPETRRYNMRRDLYFRLYKLIIASPELAVAETRSLRKTIAKIVGFTVTQEIWLPFVKSLEQTIMQQRTMEDLSYIKRPMDIIYGSLDMLVIRGNPRKVLGEVDHIHTHTIMQKHRVSERASKFIAGRIEEASAEAKGERQRPKSHWIKTRHTFREP